MIHQWNWPTVDAGRADRADMDKEHDALKTRCLDLIE